MGELGHPRSVRQALRNWSAEEILEACSCAKSETQKLYVKQQLQHSARSALGSRRVSRIRVEQQERSGSSRRRQQGRGTGDVVGGELDAISIEV